MYFHQVRLSCTHERGDCYETSAVRQHLKEYFKVLDYGLKEMASKTDGQFNWMQLTMRYCK